jgi:hypothetical protein
VRRDHKDSPRHCLVDNTARLTNNTCGCINWIRLDLLMARFRVSKKNRAYIDQANNRQVFEKDCTVQLKTLILI